MQFLLNFVLALNNWTIGRRTAALLLNAFDSIRKAAGVVEGANKVVVGLKRQRVTDPERAKGAAGCKAECADLRPGGFSENIDCRESCRGEKQLERE